MKTISLSNFSNGVQDPRARINGGCISSRHFILESTKLTPYRDMETEALDTGTLADQRLTDVIRFIPTNQVQQIFALGQASTSNAYPKFYQKSTTDNPASSFQAIANGEDTTGTVIPGSLIGYKGDLYCLKTRAGSTYLVKHVYATSITEVGAIGFSPANGVVPQMFVHPKDNKLYIASGYTAASYDGSTISTRDFSTGHSITAITYYGNNIMLGMVSKDSNSSVVAVWDGSVTSSVLIDLIDWGNDTLLVLMNINDTLIGVSGISVGGSANTGVHNTVNVRGYTGGTAQIIKSIESVGSLGSRVYPLRTKRNNTGYFPMSAYLNGTLINQIWAIYKNNSGVWVVTPDRKPENDTEINQAATPFRGLSTIGDYMWVAYGGSIYRTNDQASYTATSSYTTLINPGMPAEDLSKDKVLRQVTVRYGSPTEASMSFNVDYSVDGGTVYQTATAVSASTDKIGVIEATNQTDGSPYLSGREFIFQLELTGYGEIYEILYKYDVINTTL